MKAKARSRKTSRWLLPLLYAMTNRSKKYHLWENSSRFFQLNVSFYLLYTFHFLQSRILSVWFAYLLLCSVGTVLQPGLAAISSNCLVPR